MNEIKKRYSDEELQEFKELIEKKLEIAKQDAEYLQDQLMEINEESDAIKAGNFDEGSQNYEREHIAKMIQRAQDFIKNLEFALIRIKNKTYGICSMTGELIDKKRLMLVPHTTKSIEGKGIEQKVVQTQKTAEAARLAALRSESGKKVITKTISKGKSAEREDGDFDEEEEDPLSDFDMDVQIDDLDLGTDIIDSEDN